MVPVTGMPTWLDRIMNKSSGDFSELPENSIHSVVTSKPYEKQRRYSDDPADLGNYQGIEFIEKLRQPLREIYRVLRPDGNAFFNFHPARVGGFVSPTLHLLPALLTEVGFGIVQVLSWLKVNAQPVADSRLLKPSIEWIYHCAKTEHYVVDKDALRVPSLWAGRDKRVHKYNALGGDRGNWFCPALDQLTKLGVQDVLEAVLGRDVDVLPLRKSQEQATIHPAKMPDELADWLIRYGSRPGDTILDPWAGSGTSLCRAKALGRHWVGYELSPEYAMLAEERVGQVRFGEALEGPVAGPGPVTGPKPAAKAIPPVGPTNRSCRHCGKAFTPKRSWQVSCSSQCRYTHWNRADTRVGGGKDDGTKTNIDGGGAEGQALPTDTVHLDEQAADPTSEGPGQSPV